MPLVLAGQRITAGVLSQDYSAGDTSSVTVTQATQNPLSKLWTIPANDPQPNTAYRLYVRGFGTWGGTVHNLNLYPFLTGNAVGLSPTLDSSVLSASATFRWSMWITLMCLTTGSSGTWQLGMTGVVTQTANNVIPGTAANNTIPFEGGNSTPYTQDTTVANTLAAYAAWGNTTGAPTLTSTFSLFEKCGG